MPGPLAFSAIEMVRPAPESVTGGISKCAPVSFVTWIVPVAGSTVSDKVTLTELGVELYGKTVSGAGVDEAYFACAATGPGRSAARRSVAHRTVIVRFIGQGASC